ncbi:fcer1g [Pungitius sinensis]
MNVCFILDGVLILYGIVLTVLYCRLRMIPSKKKAATLPQKPSGEGGIYEGLTTQSTDVYETIKMEKPPV